MENGNKKVVEVIKDKGFFGEYSFITG